MSLQERFLATMERQLENVLANRTPTTVLILRDMPDGKDYIVDETLSQMILDVLEDYEDQVTNRLKPDDICDARRIY